VILYGNMVAASLSASERRCATVMQYGGAPLSLSSNDLDMVLQDDAVLAPLSSFGNIDSDVVLMADVLPATFLFFGERHE